MAQHLTGEQAPSPGGHWQAAAAAGPPRPRRPGAARVTRRTPSRGPPPGRARLGAREPRASIEGERRRFDLPAPPATQAPSRAQWQLGSALNAGRNDTGKLHFMFPQCSFSNSTRNRNGPDPGSPACCGYSRVLKSLGLLILLKLTPSLIPDQGVYLILARPKAICYGRTHGRTFTVNGRAFAHVT